MRHEGVVVTIGLPLPNILEYETDVSWRTRHSINEMTKYSNKLGITVHEQAVRSVSVPHNHNELGNKFTGEWLLICGSDHAFPENALEILLDATKEEPFPKIIGGITPFRSKPYRYVANMYDRHKESVIPIVPYLDFHPAQTLSGEIKEVDAIGSGFCLYHRSVFDSMPYPWFRYAPKKINDGFLQETIREFNGKSFPEFLEGLVHGDTFLSDSDREELTKKAKALRTVLGQSRCPLPYGPDYTMCLDAQAYGFKSYVHFGCVVLHLAYEPIHPGHYVQYARDPMNWWHEAMARIETVDDVQEIKEYARTIGLEKMLKMTPDELEADGVEKANVQGESQ